MNPSTTLCKAHDKSPAREVNHALVDRSQVILGNPVNDQENRVNGQPLKRCGNGVCLAILLMLNGCANSPLAPIGETGKHLFQPPKGNGMDSTTPTAHGEG